MTEGSPVVRVFVPTYRRPTLLRRALLSLQNQSFHDWVCEVRNDAPDDPGPAAIVEELRDARFKLVQHQRNVGGTAMFNLIFRATAEPFYSLLEDDNWWEPEFLSTMLAVARQFPDCDIFWANQRIWDEQADGSFRDSGAIMRDESFATVPQAFAWPHPSQLFGPLHSAGAMLVRSHDRTDYQTPADTPLSAVESFRERIWRYPVVFVPAPIANWSVTLQTHRSRSPAEHIMLQVMLAATLLKHWRLSDTEASQIWNDARRSRYPTTSVLIYAGLVEPGCRHFLKHANAGDWARFLRTAFRRPLVPWTVFRSRRTRPGLWTWLDDRTAARFADAGAEKAGTLLSSRP